MSKQQVMDKAVGVIGSLRTATAWMKVKHPALDGRSPEDLLETEEGRYHLYEILCRIDAEVTQ